MWGNQLFWAKQRRDGNEGTRILEAVLLHFDDDLTVADIDLAIYQLFSKDCKTLDSLTLIQFIDAVYTDSIFSITLTKAFILLEKLLRSVYKEKFDIHINQIVNTCLSILRSACTAKVKEKCILPLKSIVQGNWPDPIPSIVDILLKHLIKKNEKPSVMAKEYDLIGSICKLYPELVADKTDIIGKSLLQTTEDYVDGRVKISTVELEGCFIGLLGFIDKFFEPYMSDIIYKSVKYFSIPGEQHRRIHARAALKIIADYGLHFSAQLSKDFIHWHKLLINWINQPNADDKKSGYSALFSYYKSIGEFIKAAGECDDSYRKLKYFMDYFKNILAKKFNFDEESSLEMNTYEMKYALKGFTVFVSNCRSLFNEDDIKEISKVITQRALLLYRDNYNEDCSISKQADEESTEKIEELCNHIDALAVVGINVDHNLESLTCILISDFPKCAKHRQFIVMNSLKQSLKVVNVKVVITHLIKESCKYYISSSLYYNMNYDSSSPVSYVTFIPLCKSILEIGNQYSNMSLQIYDKFMAIVLEMLPNFDLSVKTRSKNLVEDDELLDLEAFEIPLFPFDYRLFTNICDLTASIISFEWTHEWFKNWIDPFLSLLLEERKNSPNVTGYLRLIEAVFKVVKNPNYITDNLTEPYTVESKIIELLNGLSVSNTNGIIQLRSALIFLNIPPQLFHEDLLKETREAFKVILKIGKNDLNLVGNALESLEEWNVYIERDILHPLFKEVLPMLNEYLCSSGTFDDKILESNENKSRKTKKQTIKEGISPQLASLQRRIILFISKMDSLTTEPLVQFKSTTEDVYEEEKKSLYMSEYMKISLPCPQQQKLNIYLDLLLPRIIDLSLHSSNRDTRLAACQTLHSCILLMYGTSVSLPPSQKISLAKMYKELFTAMLYLAADADDNVSLMFSPLLKQSCHWFSNPQHTQSDEAGYFITALLKGSSHSSDSIIRERSCQALKEFILWSVKKSSIEQLQFLPSNISAIIRSVSQMMLYPNDNERHGGYLIFDCVISQMYNLDSAIDKHLLELLYSVVKSIENSIGTESSMAYLNNPHLELGLKVLDKLLRCLQRKSYIFKTSNSYRRIPQCFGNGTLKDVLLWLIAQGKSTYCEITKMCYISFSILSKNNYKIIETITSNIPYVIKHNLEWEIENFDPFNSTSLFMKNSFCLYRTIDNFVIVLSNKIFNCDKMIKYIEGSNIITFIITYLKLLDSNMEYINSPNDKILKEAFEKNLYLISWKIYEFITILVKLDTTLFLPLLNDEVLKSLCNWILDKHKILLMHKYALYDVIKVKDVIKILKEHSPQKFSAFENILMDSMKTNLLNQLSTLIAPYDSETKITIMSLNEISNIITLIDDSKRLNIYQEFKFDNILNTFFDGLFDSDLDIISFNISDSNKMGDYLKFILESEIISPEALLKILSREDVVSDYSLEYSLQKKYLTYGGYCLYKFDKRIMTHILKCYKVFFDTILKMISNDNKINYILLIEQILKYSSEGSVAENLHVEYYKSITELFINIWPKFIQWNSFDELIQFYSMLAYTLPNPIKYIGLIKNNLNEWLIDSFINDELEIENKLKLIVLLPTILEPGISEHWYSQNIKYGLDKIHESLPISCHEFKPFTKKRSTYVKIINTILECMTNSGSYCLLEFIIKTSIVDDEHICKEEINRKVKSLMKRLNDDDQLSFLSEVNNFIKSETFTEKMLLNLMKRFMIPMLQNSSATVIEKYYVKNISSIFESMEKEVTKQTSQFWVDRIIVRWIIAYNLLELMFLKINFSKLDLPDSEIANSVYKEQPPPQKFVKDIFTKAFQLRRVIIPLETDKSKEFLRLSRCAAYKCLYAIITARPKNELKFYMFLLNHNIQSSNNIWEGIIDKEKVYVLPIKSNKITKSRNHLVPTKQTKTYSNSMVNFEESFRVLSSFQERPDTVDTSDKRHSLLHATLADNLSKFDLNSALIRDSGSFSINERFKKVDILHTSLLLGDDELNNHECMATVCQLIRDVYGIVSSDIEIEKSQSTQSGSSNQIWIKCIADLLSDTSRDKNVRMFLAQVVDNVRDVFGHFSKTMFLPILLVIRDRCTSSAPAINYLDLCLLSLLLSWKNDVIPESEDEVMAASSVLQFVIDEISPSLGAEVFKHCLELLHTIVEIWGKAIIIPCDLMIEKIETKPENKKAAIQIAAAVLINNLKPWDNRTYDKFQNHILLVLKSDEKLLYKPTAEVVGLMLKFFNNNESPEDKTKFVGNVLVSLNAMFTEKKHEKFIICLHHIQKYHFGICDDSMLSKVTFLVEKFPTEQKKFCFDIFLRSMDVIADKSLYSELALLSVENLLKDKRFRIYTLHIINKAIDRLNVVQIDSLFKDIDYLCELSINNDIDCRTIVYEILIKIYNEYYKNKHKSNDIQNISNLDVLNKKRREDFNEGTTSKNEDKSSKKVITIRCALLNGLDDEDVQLRMRLLHFWNDKFSQNLQERWIDSLSGLLSEYTGDGIPLGKVIKILLNVCCETSDYQNTKIFDNPLEDCIHLDYDWKINVNKKNNSILPLFAETLNSQLLMSSILEQNESGKPINKRDIKTLQSINLSISQKPFFKSEETFLKNTLESFNETCIDIESTAMKSSKVNPTHDGFNLTIENSLLFTAQPELLHRQTYKPLPRQVNREQIRDCDLQMKLRKKFIANKNQEIIKFTGIHASKQKKLEEKRLEKKSVESFKQFKDGDYPDVQINLSDVLNPILELISRDVTLAKDFFVILFKSLCDHIKELSYVKDFKIAVANVTLNLLKTECYSMPQTPMVVALLQICRLSLNECCKMENFNEVINDMSKQCSVEWLGRLILEEKEIYFSEMTAKNTAKRLKPDKSLVANSELVKEYNDKIYNLATIGNWLEINNIFASGSVDENLNDEYKLKYTEDYFESFAMLSNWEEFVNRIKYQFSPDNTDESMDSSYIFNFDNLWKKPWMKNKLLPLMFDANIHKFNNSIIIDGAHKFHKSLKADVKHDIENFSSAVNDWMENLEKKQYLNTNLSSKIGLWKSVIKPNDSSLNFINMAIESIKTEWMQENFYNKRNDSRFNIICKNVNNKITLNTMQMLGEICNLLESPIFHGTSTRFSAEKINSSLNATIKNWSCCVPGNSDNTRIWDLRLACRSILSVKIQKNIKSRMSDCDDENDFSDMIINNLAKTQRFAELCLVKRAIQCLNFPFAEKYIMKHSEYLDKDEEMPWGLELAKMINLKAVSQLDVKNRLSLTMKAWKMGEKVRVCFTVDDDPTSYQDLLINAAQTSLNVCIILTDNEKLENIDMMEVNESLIEIFAEGRLFKGSIANSVMTPGGLTSTLIKYGESYLQTAVDIAKKYMKNNPINSISNTYMEVVKYCKKVNDVIDKSEDFDVTPNLVLGILKAMKYGNSEAQKMFPMLLVIFDRLPNDHCALEIFKREVIDICTSMFLPWVSQLLAHLPLLKDALLDLILKISNEYPQSIMHPYRLSKQMWKTQSNAMNDIIEKLDSKLHNEDMENLIIALGSVCDPCVLLKTHLENIIKLGEKNDKSVWNRAFEELFEEVFPDLSGTYLGKIRGSLFKKIEPYKSALEQLHKDTMESSVPDGRKKVIEFYTSHQFDKKSIKSGFMSLNDFSPYLTSFGENELSFVHVFGQYGLSSGVPSVLHKYITISKFESEVMVINSLRRPIRFSILGSNGKKYMFLMKRGEDLRQDERIQQLFSLMSDYLNVFDMNISSYKVVPLSSDFGIIQWVTNCYTLKDIILKYDTQTNDLIIKLSRERKHYLSAVPGDNIVEKYSNIAANLQDSIAVYKNILNKVPKYLLRDCLSKIAISPENFVFMKNNYMKSLAPMSVSQWILGIGDRHMSNCLLSLNTGNLIGIDFGHAFGTATQLLSIPELIPFRFSPQLLNVLAPYGYKGDLRQLMIDALQCFRENSTLLLAVMEVFVSEPSMNWVHQTCKNDSIVVSDAQQSQWMPNIKIDQIKRKLSGIMPLLITIEDLKMQTVEKHIIQPYISAVRASKLEGLTSEDLDHLTITKQVDCLINQATNAGLLAITYDGWEPWL